MSTHSSPILRTSKRPHSVPTSSSLSSSVLFTTVAPHALAIRLLSDLRTLRRILIPTNMEVCIHLALSVGIKQKTGDVIKCSKNISFPLLDFFFKTKFNKKQTTDESRIDGNGWQSFPSILSRAKFTYKETGAVCCNHSCVNKRMPTQLKFHLERQRIVK